MKRRFLALFCAMVMLAGILMGCSASAKTFDTGKGLKITLNSSFKEDTVDGFDAYYEAPNYAVVVLKEGMDTLSGVGLTEDSSVKDYADLVIQANGKGESIKEKDGITYFTYESSAEGRDFEYLATVFKGSDAFWMVQFFCEAKNYDKYEEKFFEWAKSVEIE